MTNMNAVWFSCFPSHNKNERKVRDITSHDIIDQTVILDNCHRRQVADLPAKVAKTIGCAYKRGCSLEIGWSPIFVKILGHNSWS